MTDPKRESVLRCLPFVFSNVRFTFSQFMGIYFYNWLCNTGNLSRWKYLPEAKREILTCLLELTFQVNVDFEFERTIELKIEFEFELKLNCSSSWALRSNSSVNSSSIVNRIRTRVQTNVIKIDHTLYHVHHPLHRTKLALESSLSQNSVLEN